MGNRIFIYDGREFPDPDAKMTPDEVRQSMSQFFPELSNAEVKESKKGENTVIEFKKRVGTKGKVDTVNGYQRVAEGVEHPAPHNKGVYGDVWRHEETGAYTFLVGRAVLSCPQDWGARLHAAYRGTHRESDIAEAMTKIADLFGWDMRREQVAVLLNWLYDQAQGK